MANAFVLDAVSEKVMQRFKEINKILKSECCSGYELQDDIGLHSLMMDVNEALFYQYCVNHKFNTDSQLELKEAIRSYIDYMHHGMLDWILEDYDPEEDLG